MQFQLTHSLPNKCWVAVSGGMDSMAALHWLNKAKKVSGVLHVNHHTGEFSTKAQTLVAEQARYLRLPVATMDYHDPDKSEEAMRNARYQWFNAMSHENIVVAHNMNDCLEEYIMCTMKRGYIGTIPYRHGNVIRPFRKWKRADIACYAIINKIKFINDPSNTDTNYMRNHIRHNIVPQVTWLNYGIFSLVDKAIDIQDEYDNPNKVTPSNRFAQED